MKAKRFKKILRKLEIIADRSIPYALLLLLLLVVGELFFADKFKPYSFYVSIIDNIIIGIFIVDLSFKYRRSRSLPMFFRNHWLDIIAVFPAFLVVRLIEEFAVIVNLEETILISQEALEVGEKAGLRANRIHYFSRFIRPLARLPRFLKAFKFYERPHIRFLD